jgi:hypothetical protein
MRVRGVKEQAGSSVLARGRTIQGILHPPASSAKYFGCVGHKCKIFYISTALDQDLLYLTAFRSKYFVFRLRSYAPDQNPLDLIGFLLVGSCRIPDANLHPSPDRRRHLLNVSAYLRFVLAATKKSRNAFLFLVQRIAATGSIKRI